MAPGPKKRPSAFDKFGSASAAAVSSGFSAVLAMGPQPSMTRSEGQNFQGGEASQAGPSNSSADQGSHAANDWLHDLPNMSNYASLGNDEMSDGDSDSSSAQAGKNASSTSRRRKSGASSKDKIQDTAPSTEADRKEQNRLAQREFRQRKQQYIRALEARVELLSSSHDVQVDRLRYALRGLLAENNQLRSIVASFGNFVGLEHAGGPLQKIGMSRQELEQIINGSAEKVMTDGWSNWPGATESEALKQLRLEARLPPEGLPESARLSEQAKANTQMSRITALEKEASKSPTSREGEAPSKTANRKRKVSSVSGGNDGNKRSAAQSGQMPSSGTPMNNSTSSSSSTSGQAPQLTSMPLTSQPHSQPHIGHIPPELLMSFASGGDAGLTSAQQDPSSLMAGLFGNFPSHEFDTEAFLSDHGQPLTFHLPAQHFDGSNELEKESGQGATVASGHIEMSEEMQRIKKIIDRLQHEGQQHGTSQDVQKLERLKTVFFDLTRHMTTFRQKPSYHLPCVLQPSEIQQTRPHDPLVDVLPYPGIRQTLIQQQENFVIDDVVLSILHFTNLHQGDPMDEGNWELLHGFLIAYPQLIDQHTLDASNRWRLARNEAKLDFEDIAP